MNYLLVKNLKKVYGEKVLFEDISFAIDKGQKVALIAKNGTGKSTLLNIISGNEYADHGEAVVAKSVKTAFLDQNPVFNNKHNVREAVLDSNNPLLETIRNYEEAIKANDVKKIDEYTEKMSDLNAWDYEVKIHEILSKLKINYLDKPVSILSGGQKKRIALAKILIDRPDFLILDEPTNHLDLNMIEWIENYLDREKITLFMVTHDRYFLEKVCDQIIELDGGKIYKYKGNYSYFLEKKADREANEAKNLESAQNLYRKELKWIRVQPRARGTKSKSRVDAFAELKKRAQNKIDEKKLTIDIKEQRLGGKVLELHNVNKSYGELSILKKFSYRFDQNDKIGIVGSNGVGKSTFLNLIIGKEQPDTGKIVTGETVIFGNYEQEGFKIDETKKVIDIIQDIAEFIPLKKGLKLSASQMLDRFLFHPKVQHNLASKLSGGEKKRLYLLTILMKNPNFLILDEPTNDLDLITLNVLEDFLSDFKGCLVIVSHDRSFMDKVVDHLFIFKGDGIVTDFLGKYSEYRDQEELEIAEEESRKRDSQISSGDNKSQNAKSYKLNKEQKSEIKKLERDIEKLEKRKSELSTKLDGISSDYKKIQELSEEIGVVIKEIEGKEERWVEIN